MGFSSGRSRARRKAEQAQHDSYVEALRNTERADSAKKQKTTNRREARDLFGDDLDGYSKSLLNKADRMAATYNKRTGDLNAAIDKYNERYDKLQRQFNGESIHDGYDVNITDPNANISGMGLMGLVGRTNKKEFDTLEEAEAFEPQQKEPTQTNGLAAIAGAPAQNGNANYIGFGQSRETQPLQTEVVERTQTPITHYRGTLRASSDAYNDLDRLSKGVNDVVDQAGLGNYQTEYEALANRLRNSLKRSQGVVKPAPNGLLATELAPTNPILAERLAG